MIELHAGVTVTALPVDVILPLESTVNGVTVVALLLYVPDVTPELARVAVPVTLPEPSNEPLVYVTSPVKAIVRPVANVVAVLALLVSAPTNDVEVTLVNPVSVVELLPSDIAVVPTVIELFASALFGTALKRALSNVPLVILDAFVVSVVADVAKPEILLVLIEPANIVLVTVPVSPDVMIVPVVAGIVKTVPVPTAAAGII